MFKLLHNCTHLILYAGKVTLKILQVRLQQYMNRELPDVQAGFRKRRGTRDQIANIHWIIEKARVWEKHLILLYWLCQSLWLWITTNWKILQKMGIPDHLTCLLRNLYAGQEATVRTGYGTIHWFQIGKVVHQGCLLSPCYLTHMQNTSCAMLGWMKDKLESRLMGEISITSDMQMTPPLWQKAKKN